MRRRIDRLTCLLPEANPRSNVGTRPGRVADASRGSRRHGWSRRRMAIGHEGAGAPPGRRQAIRDEPVIDVEHRVPRHAEQAGGVSRRRQPCARVAAALR